MFSLHLQAICILSRVPGERTHIFFFFGTASCYVKLWLMLLTSDSPYVLLQMTKKVTSAILLTITFGDYSSPDSGEHLGCVYFKAIKAW